MPRPDRRLLISDAALELAASGGTHALTHQAIDRHLDLPKGSTSYYFRTRDALIGAAADRLVAASRREFLESVDSGKSALDLIADYAVTLVTTRRRDVLARQALLLEPGLPTDVRSRLVGCLFSMEAATSLTTTLGEPEPDVAARELITVLEGVVFSHTQGVDARRAARSRRRIIRSLLVDVFPRLGAR
ncbi:MULTISPECIES: TetR/AcrR family transcriptional regulator [Gordonia]|uniref:TetR/AcrR family transcriptional regulator n=1 Tax=Gordonia oleivorans TaxID=3156618 RepID=UPI0032B59286